MSWQTIRVEVEGGVARVTLDRPEKKNAMNPALHHEMRDALTELASDEGIGVLVLTGQGDSFCAGMDLEQCFFEPFDDPKRFVAENKIAQAWFKTLKAFPVPTIARVNGWCVGGGVELVGLCDIAIADEAATFGLSEINFGTFPGGGTTWAVAHNLPRKLALYYILTGETFMGRDAADMGLVNRAVPADALDSAVLSVIESLLRKNRAALRAAKETYEGVLSRQLPDAIDWEMAKLHELSYISRDEWINSALAQFKDRRYRPGFEAYEPGEPDADAR